MIKSELQCCKGEYKQQNVGQYVRYENPISYRIPVKLNDTFYKLGFEGMTWSIAKFVSKVETVLDAVTDTVRLGER